MAKRIEDAALNFYDNLLLAVKSRDKQAALGNADYELERLKHYLRLCLDLNLISIKQYEFSSKDIVEMGRLLGGWMKKAAKGAG